MLRSAPQPKYFTLLLMQMQHGIAYLFGALIDILAALLSTVTVYCLFYPRGAGNNTTA